MTSDSAEQASAIDSSSPLSLANPNGQACLKKEGEALQLILPPSEQRGESNDWPEIWQQLKHRLNSGERFWQPGSSLHLLAGERLLDSRQLQAIAEALKAVELKIERVRTSRRQTAVAAAAAGYSVEQRPSDAPLSSPAEPTLEEREPPLYFKSVMRSGVEIRHPGTVIVLGDMNPGSSAIAAGDILVFGRLRGIAHAGSQGDRSCVIAALEMSAPQLRIADTVARVPPSAPHQSHPEIACIAPSGIRLARAIDFFKNYRFAEEAKHWLEDNL